MPPKQILHPWSEIGPKQQHQSQSMRIYIPNPHNIPLSNEFISIYVVLDLFKEYMNSATDALDCERRNWHLIRYVIAAHSPALPIDQYVCSKMYRSRSIVRQNISKGDINGDHCDGVDGEDFWSRSYYCTNCERWVSAALMEERSAARPDIMEKLTRYISRKDRRDTLRSIVSSSIWGSISAVIVSILLYF